MFSNFFPENRSVYEMCKNIEPDRPQVTIWRVRTACWIPKAIHTHSECVIFTDFPLQQWLHERASLLRCTHIACLVSTCVRTADDIISLLC